MSITEDLIFWLLTILLKIILHNLTLIHLRIEGTCTAMLLHIISWCGNIGWIILRLHDGYLSGSMVGHLVQVLHLPIQVWLSNVCSCCGIKSHARGAWVIIFRIISIINSILWSPVIGLTTFISCCSFCCFLPSLIDLIIIDAQSCLRRFSVDHLVI